MASFDFPGILPWIVPRARRFETDDNGKSRRDSYEDLKRVEEGLKARGDRYRFLADNIEDVLWTMDLTGNITYASPSVERLHGYSPEEVIGSPFAKLMPTDSAEKSRKVIEEALADPKGPRDIRIEALHRDGRLIPVEVKAHFLRDEKGRPFGIIGIARDITKRKEAEEELRKAKEVAEAANLAKSQFLANVSHELRTPLNAIIGMNQLLLDSDLDDRQREYARIIKQSSDHLLGIIDDILVLSSVEARKLELKPVDFDLVQVIEEVMDTIAKQARDKGLKLDCAVKPGIPIQLRGDPKRLRQVLINIADNGIKFTEQGRVRIVAALQEAGDQRATVRFSISDTGIGIPRDKLDSIFESFTQVDGSDSRTYGGTGLGLAICKEIVQMMGGRIGVETEQGKGSTFWFTAVFDEQPGCRICTEEINPTGHAEPSQEPPEQPVAEADAQGAVRILVVEDDPRSQQVVQIILRSLGCLVQSATNGKEALEELCKTRYDLVFMDVQMPVMNGLDTARAIRNPGSAVLDPKIPIVALTAHAFKEDRERCLEAGMSGYLSKPIDVNILKNVIEEHLPGAFSRAGQ